MSGGGPEIHLYHDGVDRIEGPLVFVRGVDDVGLNDQVEVQSASGPRVGRVVTIDRDNVVVEVFQGTDGLSLKGTRVRFLGDPVRFRVGPGLLGRVFDGSGRPLDGGPAIRTRPARAGDGRR